jgi:predicted RNase H-like HicB family nuclease
LQSRVGARSAIILEAGFFEEWPQMEGTATRADSEAKAQGDLVEALENEHTLLSLENDERFAPVPWRRQTSHRP